MSLSPVSRRGSVASSSTTTLPLPLPAAAAADLGAAADSQSQRGGPSTAAAIEQSLSTVREIDEMADGWRPVWTEVCLCATPVLATI
jgi:hypothetical protein